MVEFWPAVKTKQETLTGTEADAPESWGCQYHGIHNTELQQPAAARWLEGRRRCTRITDSMFFRVLSALITKPSLREQGAPRRPAPAPLFHLFLPVRQLACHAAAHELGTHVPPHASKTYLVGA